MPDFLSTNLEALAKRQPSLAQTLRSFSPAGQIQVSPSDSGEPTAALTLADGTTKRLHSRRNPRREASEWAASWTVAPSKTVALFGMGLGYPVEEFLNAHKANIGGLWCFESSLEVFREMLGFQDWRWLIEDPKIRLIVGASEQEFRGLSSGAFQQVMVDGIDMVDYQPAVQLSPEWYAARRQNLLDLVRQWSSEMLTVMERGRLFMANTLSNFRDMASSYLLRDAGEVLLGRPAILVSAGPSLNKNAKDLAMAKGRIPILCVDTSLRILESHGIVPDLAVSIDSLGLSRRHFEGVAGLEDIPLVYDLEATPEVVRNYPGPLLLVGNAKPILYSWIAEVTGPLEGLAKGLTVAQAAFLLLAKHGASPIILVGQDLSFEREGGKTHADGAAFQGRFEPGQSGRGKWEDPLEPKGLDDIPILWVQANDGGTVPTTHTLFAYLKRFEEDIAATGARTINATEGGAFIQGTEVASLHDTLGELVSSGIGDFPGFPIESKAANIGTQFGQQLEAMKGEMLALLAKARTVCEGGLEKSDKLYRDLGWKDLSDRDLRRRVQEILDAFGWIRNTAKIQMLIDRGVMKSLYMLHKGDLPAPDGRTPEQHRIVTERYRQFFAEALDMIALALKSLA
jgi:hypothetical protein